MAKLNKILESIENLKLTTEVALLENTEVTELVRAQSKLMINENINFIKAELTKGGILEDVQFMLKNAWTQTLMEDISMDTFRNMIPTGEDVDKFAKNVYNTGKDFSMDNLKNSIPTGEDVDKFAKNAYNTGKAFINENIPKFTNSEHAAAIANLNSQHANALAAINAQHANEVGGLQSDIGSYQNSQAGLIGTLGGKGANLGVQADGVYADGVNKANQIANQATTAYGQAKDMVNAIPGQAQAVPGQVAALGAKIGANVQGVYDGASQGLGAKLNADGSPMTNNQMAGIGAGSAAIAAGAGYGAHKLAQKVRRSNTFR